MAEIVLKMDGRVFRRDYDITGVPEQEVNIDESIMSAVASQMVRKVPNIATLPDFGPVSVTVLNQASSIVSGYLAMLPIRTTAKVEEKLVRATFAAKGELVTFPWTPPEGMRLMFAVRIAHPKNAVGKFQVEYAYLFAFGSDNTAYRLPIPNLFDEGRMCLGTFENAASTMLGMFQNVHRYVVESRWNDHIMRDSEQRKMASESMFRFEADGESFKTLPPTGDWKKLCTVIGTPMISQLCL